ncbi:MAG: hypothetical protein LBG15_13130 [Dysgonamonadaceae bacterium]|jgi:hypothetical protein|nr:hypothetical protein [Dysgonamonadaceae bacterium]
MTEYTKKIESLAINGGTNEIFYNSCESHALIVLINLVKNADTYIKSICGNMCSEVSNNPEYVESVRSFLNGNKTRKFQILFDKYDISFQSRPIAKTLAMFPNQVEIRKLKSGYIKYNDKPVHITVSDDRAFRFETDIEKKMAWGNFNNPKQGKAIAKVFDHFFDNRYSERVPLIDTVC